jgi:hypothetical protein
MSGELINQEVLKLARQFQADELNYRRTHRWDILSWASGLLLGGIGGLFAISRVAQHSSPAKQKIVLIVTIFVFTGYAIIWQRYHYEKEIRAKGRLSRIDKKLLETLAEELKLMDLEAEPKANDLTKKSWLKRVSFDEITIFILGFAAVVVVCFS